jgi:hypothetical protein
VVTPTVTSTYSLTCTGTGGSATQSTTVTVTTTPPPTTAKFKAGDRVQTTATTEVRQQQYLDGTILGSQPTGALGTVVGGPFVRADGTSAWNIDFDNAPDGWVKETYLVLSSATPPPPTSWDYSLSGNPSITITKSSISDVTASYTLTKTLTAGTPTPYIYTTATPSPSGSGIIVGYSIRDCAPSATIGSSCQSTIIFTVPPTASAQTYTVLTTNQPKTSSWVDAPPYKEFSFNLVVNSPTVSAPIVSISASPTSISTGQSSTLSWVSSNTTSCSASGSWDGDKPLSGSQVVTPTVTSNYVITCLGGGTSTGDSVTVTVTFTPTPPPPSSGISIGDWIQVTEKVSVRYLPTTDSKRLGVQYPGTKGQVIGGPAQGSGYTWWNIDYTVAPDGWSVENYITETTAPTAMAVGSRVTTADNIKVRNAPNGERIGRQSAGSQGTITAGPILSGGYTWWNVNFDSGTDGWAAGSYLAGQ